MNSQYFSFSYKLSIILFFLQYSIASDEISHKLHSHFSLLSKNIESRFDEKSSNLNFDNEDIREEWNKESPSNQKKGCSQEKRSLLTMALKNQSVYQTEEEKSLSVYGRIQENHHFLMPILRAEIEQKHPCKSMKLLGDIKIPEKRIMSGMNFANKKNNSRTNLKVENIKTSRKNNVIRKFFCGCEDGK